MKKQFFYAAMALAVMSSCSKDNDPGIGNPDDNNDKAVIALGVDWTKRKALFAKN